MTKGYLDENGGRGPDGEEIGKVEVRAPVRREESLIGQGASGRAEELVDTVINDSNVKLPKLKTVLTNAAAVVKKADEALKLANSACTAVSGLMASE